MEAPTAGRRFSLLRSEVSYPAGVYVSQLTIGIQSKVEVLLKNGDAVSRMWTIARIAFNLTLQADIG